MSNYEQLIAECDALIKVGEFQKVGAALRDLNTSSVPRKWRLPLASICRRAGLHSLGLKLLYKIVHPKTSHVDSEPSSMELAEYGVLLLRHGAQREALEILNRVDAKSVPNALLYSAYCHFSHWDFEQAVPVLQDFVKRADSPYMELVGKVNLAYAFVSCSDFEPALALLEELLATTEKDQNKRLQANCFELRSQIYLNQNDFIRANQELERAQALLDVSRSTEHLLIKRWRAIVRALQNSDLQEMLVFRAEALEAGDWDSLREADRYALRIEFDQRRFDHLVFGTPSRAYVDRVCRELGRQPVSESYLLGEAGSACLDISDFEVDGRPILSPGKRCHQLIDVLLRDFYRPLRIGGLYAEIFKTEHFDIFTSPGRIHQYLFRIRESLENNGLPLEIVEDKGFYSLQIRGFFSIRIPRVREDISGPSLHIQKLKEIFSNGAHFSAREASEKMGIPRASLHRVLKSAIEAGAIESFGTNKSTRYRVIRSPLKSVA